MMTHNHISTREYKGFTIVELLIVIVVIAVLAAISIVAYNGIRQRAESSSSASAASQALRKVKTWQVENENITPTCAKFYELVTSRTDLTNCSFDYNGVNYQYTAGTNGNYCATTTAGSSSYRLSEGSTVTTGGCAGHAQNGAVSITNFARDPSAVTSTGNFSSMGGAPAPTSDSIATDRAHHGSSSLRLTVTGSGGTGRKALTAGNPRFNTGETLSWSFWIYSTKAGTLHNYAEGSRVSDGSYTGCGGTPSSVSIPANTWTKVSANCILTTDTYVGGAGGYNLAVISGDTVWLDEFMITRGSTQYNYADGSSANWIWNGTANNATSTGPAP